MAEVEVDSIQQATAMMMRWATIELTMKEANVAIRIRVTMLMMETMISFSWPLAFFTRPDIISARVRKIIGTTKPRTKAAAHFEKC